MDFYDVLDQVVALLRRCNRVTYRALKLQFKLDDEALETLQDELLKAQRLAVDEEGEVLFWIGDTATAQTHSPPTPQPELPPATSDTQVAQVLSLPAVPAADQRWMQQASRRPAPLPMMRGAAYGQPQDALGRR